MENPPERNGTGKGIGGFLLEAKASWGHTGIAGGFIAPRYNKKKLSYEVG